MSFLSKYLWLDNHTITQPHLLKRDTGEAALQPTRSARGLCEMFALLHGKYCDCVVCEDENPTAPKLVSPLIYDGFEIITAVKKFRLICLQTVPAVFVFYSLFFFWSALEKRLPPFLPYHPPHQLPLPHNGVVPTAVYWDILNRRLMNAYKPVTLAEMFGLCAVQELFVLRDSFLNFHSCLASLYLPPSP